MKSSSDRSRSGNEVPESSVAAMFDSIAPVYDRMNTLMTVGMDGRWRRAAVKAARLEPGQSAVDVACGTGKLSAELARAIGPIGRVVGVDLAPAMLEEARRVCADLVQVTFVEGNALALPFEDATFEAATIAFGLRNLADFEQGFREMARPRPVGRAYVAIFGTFAPVLGSLFRRRRAYAYLPHSLAGFPEPNELAETMRNAGLEQVTWRRLALGAVALHEGVVA